MHEFEKAIKFHRRSRDTRQENFSCGFGRVAGISYVKMAATNRGPLFTTDTNRREILIVETFIAVSNSIKDRHGSIN